MRFRVAYAAAADGWPEGYESLDIDTSWGRTHVLAAGKDDAPTAVLLHGDGATATVWAGMAAELASSFRVLAPDQPGNPGLSSSSRAFRTTSHLMSWLDELIGAMDRGPVHLVGHSSGAHLALAHALEHPQRLASLTLLDPTFCFAGMSPRYLLHALPTLVRPTPAGVRRFLGWETRGRALDPRWLEAFVEGATAFERTPIVPTRRPDRDRLARLAVPLLVVVAGSGRAHDASRVARNARAAVPPATVVEVAGATHHTMPVLDAGEIAAAMTAHVGGAAKP